MRGKHSRACLGIKGCVCLTCAKDSDECCIRLHGAFDDCPIEACEEYEQETDDDNQTEGGRQA